MAKAVTRAAQYLRMSSDSQDFSIPTQIAVNTAYAQERGMEIVRTYSDEGLSGLNIKKRAGLKDLLAHVVAGDAPFQTILVHDVSRWGRFQNPDQAAHYEFICAEAGVSVTYTAEPFVNDGSPTSSLLKQIKRTMAAEYSRELSAKVSRAKRGLAMRGYWMGGTPPLGLGRVIEEPDGTRHPYVEGAGWRKKQGFHTRLIVGAAEEVALVRLIFTLFLRPSGTAASVALALNQLGHQTKTGKAWTPLHVARTLKCSLYRGQMEFGRQTQDLTTRAHQPVAREDWLLVDDVVPSIIPVKVFQAAGRKMAALAPGATSVAAALADVRRVLAEHGDVSQTMLDRHGRWATSTYIRRLGSISRIREIVGAPTPSKFRGTVDRLVLARERQAYTGRIFSDGQLIACLRAVLLAHGRIDHALMKQSPGTPTVSTYTRRFGSMLNAYALAGYQPDEAQMRFIRATEKRSRTRLAHLASIAAVAS